MKAKFAIVIPCLALITIASGGRQSGGFYKSASIKEAGTMASDHCVLGTIVFQPTAPSGSSGTDGEGSLPDGTTGVSTTGSTTGGTSFTNYYFYVAGGSSSWAAYALNGNSSATQASASVPPGPPVGGVAPTSVAANGFKVNNPDDAVDMRDLACSNGDQVTTFMVKVTKVVDSMQGVLRRTYVYSRMDVKLVKVGLGAVSVDSRKVYGQPDIAGEIPADGNAPLRNPNFSGWIYKGGLFTGFAAPNSQDQSGVARIQLTGTIPALSSPLCSCTSMVYLGMPASFASSVTLGIFAPSPTDPNIGQNQGTVTWATAWALPGASIGTFSLSSSTTPLRYLSVPAGVPSAGAAKYTLAINNESTYAAGSSSTWGYFAGPSYSPPSPVWPLTDAAPRLWALDVVFSNSWTVDLIY